MKPSSGRKKAENTYQTIELFMYNMQHCQNDRWKKMLRYFCLFQKHSSIVVPVPSTIEVNLVFFGLTDANLASNKLTGPHDGFRTKKKQHHYCFCLLLSLNCFISSCWKGSLLTAQVWFYSSNWSDHSETNLSQITKSQLMKETFHQYHPLLNNQCLRVCVCLSLFLFYTDFVMCGWCHHDYYTS